MRTVSDVVLYWVDICRVMVPPGTKFPFTLVSETFNEYFKVAGVRVAVVGKTHMRPDDRGLQRIWVATMELSRVLSKWGFEQYARDDGLHPTAWWMPDYAYNEWLTVQRYGGNNPWNDTANSALGPDGELLSGWALRNSGFPARVAEEHSETAYTTDGQ